MMSGMLAWYPSALSCRFPVCAQRTEDERFEARQEAARNAVNIDDQERRRRVIFGGALLVRRLRSHLRSRYLILMTISVHSAVPVFT
jgi:hypothetical protein